MRWPGFEIVDGPTLVGLQQGDHVAVDVGQPILLYPGPSVQPFGFDIDVDEHVDIAAAQLREEDDRYRQRYHRPRIVSVSDRGWLLDDKPAPSGSVHVAGPWRLRLLDDVGAVPTVRRVDKLLLGRPLGVRMAHDALLSIWLLVGDPSHYALWHADGTISPLLRRVGAPLDQLRRANVLGGALDPERAKAVAVVADGAPLPLFIGFHGEVFHAGAQRTGWSALEHFCRLIGQPLAWERDRPAAQAAFDRTEAADVDALADLARALDPDGWQREQLLREECALLA